MAQQLEGKERHCRHGNVPHCLQALLVRLSLLCREPSLHGRTGLRVPFLLRPLLQDLLVEQGHSLTEIKSIKSLVWHVLTDSECGSWRIWRLNFVEMLGLEEPKVLPANQEEASLPPDLRTAGWPESSSVLLDWEADLCSAIMPSQGNPSQLQITTLAVLQIQIQVCTNFRDDFFEKQSWIMNCITSSIARMFSNVFQKHPHPHEKMRNKITDDHSTFWPCFVAICKLESIGHWSRTAWKRLSVGMTDGPTYLLSSLPCSSPDREWNGPESVIICACCCFEMCDKIFKSTMTCRNQAWQGNPPWRPFTEDGSFRWNISKFSTSVCTVQSLL